MLPENKIGCVNNQGVLLCKSSSPEITAIYTKLLQLIQNCYKQLGQARPDVASSNREIFMLPTDGTVGPMLAFSTQQLLSILNHSQPLSNSLKPILSIQADEGEIIKRVGFQADEIIGYITVVLSQNPKALISSPNQNKTISTIKGVTGGLAKKVLIAGIGLAGVGGLAFLVHKKNLAQRGLIDQTDWLED